MLAACGVVSAGGTGSGVAVSSQKVTHTFTFPMTTRSITCPETCPKQHDALISRHVNLLSVVSDDQHVTLRPGSLSHIFAMIGRTTFRFEPSHCGRGRNSFQDTVHDEGHDRASPGFSTGYDTTNRRGPTQERKILRRPGEVWGVFQECAVTVHGAEILSLQRRAYHPYSGVRYLTLQDCKI